MRLKVGINGLGRIGRLFLRQVVGHPNIEVVGINDLVPADNLAYLLKYDSTHGRAEFDIRAEGDQIIINNQKITVTTEKDPTKLPWKGLITLLSRQAYFVS